MKAFLSVQQRSDWDSEMPSMLRRLCFLNTVNSGEVRLPADSRRSVPRPVAPESGCQ